VNISHSEFMGSLHSQENEHYFPISTRLFGYSGYQRLRRALVLEFPIFVPGSPQLVQGGDNKGANAYKNVAESRVSQIDIVLLQGITSYSGACKVFSLKKYSFQQF
jgi:hypothetical protein